MWPAFSYFSGHIFLERTFEPRNELTMECFVVKKTILSFSSASHMGLCWQSHFLFGLLVFFFYFFLNYERGCKALASLSSLMAISSVHTCQALVIMPWLWCTEPDLLFLASIPLRMLFLLPGGPSFIWFTWGVPLPPFKNHLGPTSNVHLSLLPPDSVRVTFVCL